MGTALDAAVRRALSEGGVHRLKAVVGADNGRAGDFYEGRGYRHVTDTSVHAGERSHVWVAGCPS